MNTDIFTVITITYSSKEAYFKVRGSVKLEQVYYLILLYKIKQHA